MGKRDILAILLAAWLFVTIPILLIGAAFSPSASEYFLDLMTLPTGAGSGERFFGRLFLLGPWLILLIVTGFDLVRRLRSQEDGSNEEG